MAAAPAATLPLKAPARTPTTTGRCFSLGSCSARESSTTTPPYGKQTMASASASSATASVSVDSSPAQPSSRAAVSGS